VSSAPIACANVLVSLFLSAPMALGTDHIHLLDTELFSDYSPPIELSGFGRVSAAEETTEISRLGKTESACQTRMYLLESKVDHVCRNVCGERL
jgi:hypothetical protein